MAILRDFYSMRKGFGNWKTKLKRGSYVELDMCEKCPAQEYCGTYEEYVDAHAEEDNE